MEYKKQELVVWFNRHKDIPVPREVPYNVTEVVEKAPFSVNPEGIWLRLFGRKAVADG